MHQRRLWELFCQFWNERMKDALVETFAAEKHHLAAVTKQRPLCGGWRIDREKEEWSDRAEKDEFVLFTGCDDVAHHVSFERTERLKEFKRIRDSIDGAEIKHGTRLEL